MKFSRRYRDFELLCCEPFILYLHLSSVARVVAPKKEKLKEANATLAVAMKVRHTLSRSHCKAASEIDLPLP